MERTWVSTVLSVSQSRFAIAAFVRPSAISASTSCSRGVNSPSASSCALRRDERGDDLRIERRAPLGHPSRGVEEVVDVEHTVLEQIPEAAS